MADLLDLGHPLDLPEPLGEQPDLGLEADQRPLPLEDVQGGERRRAGEGVAGVGVAVEEGLEFLVLPQERLVDALGREGRGERHVAAREPLCEAEQVRRDPLLLTGEHRPRPPEAGGDLVADQQRAMAVAEPADRAQIAGRMGQHPGRALHERLEHDRGHLLLAQGEQAGNVVDVAGLGAVRLEEERLEGPVEERHPTDRDRADRVPVVALLEADE